MSDECIVQLTNDADGNVTPLLCPGGGVNRLAWQHYAAANNSTLSSKVLGLGPDASPKQVWQAMCQDYSDFYHTNPLTISAEELAVAYYGYKFAGDDPASDFERLGCPAR